MLLHMGLDVNCLDGQGFSPVHRAVLLKNKRLLEMLLARPDLDLNKRCENSQYQEETAVHLAVRSRDYDMLMMLLEFQGNFKTEVGLKNHEGKNAADVALALSAQG